MRKSYYVEDFFKVDVEMIRQYEPGTESRAFLDGRFLERVIWKTSLLRRSWLTKK